MNWQLNLFKGKRQRGERPPQPLEFALHCMVADVLRRWCEPEWMWTHLPFGEHRSEITGARLKRMGVNPGFPDFMFIGKHKVVFLELKRKGGKLSPQQAIVGKHILDCGHGYWVTDDYEDAIGMLVDCGIVRHMEVSA